MTKDRTSEPLLVGIGEVLWDLLPDGPQLGGAPANFAYHAQQLGAEARVVSAVGDDELGREARDRLQNAGLSLEFVQIDSAHPTGSVAIVLDADGKARYEFSSDVAWDWLDGGEEITRLARRCNAVCFGTLGLRSRRSRETISDFLEACAPDALRIFDVNLRQSFFDFDQIAALAAEADVLKLNDEELPRLAEAYGLGSGLEASAAALRERFALRLTAVTCGPKGSLLVSDSETSLHLGVPLPRISDTVGAGDSFAAALAMGLLEGLSLDEINRRANRLAAWVCTQPGAMPAYTENIRKEILA